MGNWTPEGFIGQMFKIVSQYVPPSPLMESPIKWGQEKIVRQRLDNGIAELTITERIYPFHYPFSPYNVVEYYRKYFGPINRAFEVLDDDLQKNLHHDLEQLWTTHNVATNGDTAVGAEILEVIAVCK